MYDVGGHFIGGVSSVFLDCASWVGFEFEVVAAGRGHGRNAGSPPASGCYIAGLHLEGSFDHPSPFVQCFHVSAPPLQVPPPLASPHQPTNRLPPPYRCIFIPSRVRRRYVCLCLSLLACSQVLAGTSSVAVWSKGCHGGSSSRSHLFGFALACC